MKLKVSRAHLSEEDEESLDATEVDSVISGFSYSKYDDEDYHERWKDLIQFSGTNSACSEMRLPLAKVGQLMHDFEIARLSPCGTWCKHRMSGGLFRTRRWNAL
ncbi:uncharacterized protein MYCFIDRAFT_182538 [Pseudocercospora fijiensis CIRAD86]|uniref:Uncharacterized protein n=1 Tax=Pseudocercospora fijiensis (strain CIRAD86) TaxID=383855 RepID=M3B776_PSEFD|nr:uncharacterized protein MYCFIDRAFT_182538 [Pseudocercospora fijiensis CIRAD86]EME85173.1 hypothetical protein MYCFIDRAFT_182538 [Pseudocercospora fijiensis CIRAD86]